MTARSAQTTKTRAVDRPFDAPQGRAEHRRKDFALRAPTLFAVLALLSLQAAATRAQCTTDADCDDQIACTQNQCFQGSCRFNPVDAACDDGMFCNGAETCDPSSGCMAGAPPCIGSSCAEATDECICTTDADCDDEVFCNGAESCVGGACALGSDPCDDGIACTTDACDEQADSCTHTPIHSTCSNGDYCDGSEICDPAQGCIDGPDPCNDALPCTDDACNEATNTCTFTNNCNDYISCTNDICFGGGWCIYAAVHANCDDDVFCNGAETCDPANGDPQTGCKAGAPPTCDDGRDCTDDECDATTDACTNTNNCDDQIECTYNTCTVFGWCNFGPNHGYCSDGQFCNGAEVCAPATGDPVTGCDAGPNPCTDNVDCTIDTCDEGSDTCLHTPNHAACDDGIDCTQDVCDVTSGCVHTPDNAVCNDGEYCNGAETCNPANGDPATGCLAGPPPCIDGLPCTDDACDEATDTCTFTNNCNDYIGCTNDICFAGGWCIYAAVHAVCDDGVFCNGAETCDPANGDPETGCKAGAPPTCDDGRACTDDVCDAATDACTHTNNCYDGITCTYDTCTVFGWCHFGPNHAPCNDGVYCNGVESCNPATGDPVTGCAEGAEPSCDDGVPCTADSCDITSDTCIHENSCDDLIDCTSDVCTAEGCEYTEVDALCDDNVDCTFDLCSIAHNGCRNLPVDAYCDDELFCTGAESCDPLLGCSSGGDPCMGLACYEVTDTCGPGCVDDSGCPAGEVCCGGLCGQCCSDEDCFAAQVCCPRTRTCHLTCNGSNGAEE